MPIRHDPALSWTRNIKADNALFRSGPFHSRVLADEYLRPLSAFQYADLHPVSDVASPQQTVRAESRGPFDSDGLQEHAGFAPRLYDGLMQTTAVSERLPWDAVEPNEHEGVEAGTNSTDGFYVPIADGPRYRPRIGHPAVKAALALDEAYRMFMQWREKHGVELHRDLAPFDKMPETANGPEAFLDAARDNDAVFRNIRRMKEDRDTLDLSSLEWHHPLPRQFQKAFVKAEIPKEEQDALAYYVWKDMHTTGRGKLHPQWNEQWREFFREKPDRRRDEIMEQLWNDPRYSLKGGD